MCTCGAYTPAQVPSQKSRSPEPNSSCAALGSVHDLPDSGFPSVTLDPEPSPFAPCCGAPSHPPAVGRVAVSDSQLHSSLTTVLCGCCTFLYAGPQPGVGHKRGTKARKALLCMLQRVSQGPDCPPSGLPDSLTVLSWGTPSPTCLPIPTSGSASWKPNGVLPRSAV